MSAKRSRRSLWITPVLSNQRLPPTLESRWPIAQVCSPPADGNAQVPSPDCPGLLHRRTGRGPDPGRTGDWRCRTLQLGESAGLLIRPAEGDPLGRTCGFGDKPMWLIQQCFSLPPAGLPSGNQAERWHLARRILRPRASRPSRRRTATLITATGFSAAGVLDCGGYWQLASSGSPGPRSPVAQCSHSGGLADLGMAGATATRQRTGAGDSQQGDPLAAGVNAAAGLGQCPQCSPGQQGRQPGCLAMGKSPMVSPYRAPGPRGRTFTAI